VLAFIGHLLTFDLYLISGMTRFPPGVPQVSGATGSSGWVGATDIPVQQGSVRFTGQTGLQGHSGIIEKR